MACQVAIGGVLWAWIRDGFWLCRQQARAVFVLLSQAVSIVLMAVFPLTFLSMSTVMIAIGPSIAPIIVATIVRLSTQQLVAAAAAAVLVAVVMVVRCPR